MAKFNGNPYYYPEKCGLEIVEFIDNTIYDYTFDYTIIWRDIETGKYYTASDSGCSCPIPFEDVNSLNDMDELPNYRKRG
jgi:hypothetical protein